MDTQDQIDKLSREVAELRDTIGQKVDIGPSIGTSCELGERVQVHHGSVLKGKISVGNDTVIWPNAQWDGPITVGSHVFVNQGSYIRPYVTIEDRVSIGPFVRIISDTHDISAGQRRTGTPRKDPIVIGAGTWIGAGATVMGGVTVGQRSIIAAGAVVTEDVPDNVLVAGVPARLIRRIADGENGATLTAPDQPEFKDVGASAL
ncbi:acyltransferase [Arthrobacter zhaoxinii]|uniref:acyltransferase n=1 Tax=Arthrobacter zhaoxinii TaxID=2964616 RepID=UPI00210457D7|nr:DapH/DapD/GlmU-related protein [Arthrobacter zhaoxinii]MCQ1999101.1 hypothetical protein [Arthrobacter zhaoxinii]